MNKTTEQKINETEEKLEELKQKSFKEEYEKSFIYIKELGIEVQKKIHYQYKSYDYLVEKFGKEFLEENLPTYSELQELRNLEHKGKYELGLINTLEFVKQEDNISKKNGYVARFIADSYSQAISWGELSGVSGSGLGVRFVRRKK